MNIQNTIYVKNQPCFGKKYPSADIMSIVSGTYLLDRADSIAKTINKLSRCSGRTECFFQDSLQNYYEVRLQLLKKYPELAEMAKNYKTQLMAINENSWEISENQSRNFIRKHNKLYGKYLDINIDEYLLEKMGFKKHNFN